MYPEDYANYQQPAAAQRSKKPIIFIIIAVVLVIVCIILAVIMQRQASTPDDASNVSDPGFKLAQTSLVANRSYTHIQGNELFSYNGASFYKQSLSDGKITVLNSGTKLPKPSSISWVGSKGAVMTFSEGFVGTRIYDALRSQRQIVNSTTKNYTWYFDFGSSSASILATSRLATNDIVPSADERGFYYAGPTSLNSAKNSTTPLSFYDIAARKSSAISANLAMDLISSMRGCRSDKFCLVGRDAGNSDETKVYVVDGTGKKENVLTAKGNVYPSNDPEKYILAEREPSHQEMQKPQARTGTDTSGAHTDTDVADVDAILFDTQDKSRTNLRFKVGINTVFPYLNEGKFTVFDNAYNSNQPRSISIENFQLGYRSGFIQGEDSESKVFPVSFKDGKPYTGSFMNIKYGQDALVAISPKQEVYIFSSSDIPDMSAADSKNVKAQVEACLPTAGQGSTLTLDENKTFTIYIPYDNNFNTRLGAFGNCLAGKGNTVLNGYYYSMIGIDPSSQRLVTD